MSIVGAGASSALQLHPVDMEPAISKETTIMTPIDPGDWPAVSDAVRTELVDSGPHQLCNDFKFPKRSDGRRSCRHHYFYRKLANGEKVKRSWLVYSEKKTACTVSAASFFQTKTSSLLVVVLMTGWIAITSPGVMRIAQNSPQEHARHMEALRELKIRLHKGQTIDKAEMALLLA